MMIDDNTPRDDVPFQLNGMLEDYFESRFKKRIETAEWMAARANLEVNNLSMHNTYLLRVITEALQYKTLPAGLKKEFLEALRFTE